MRYQAVMFDLDGTLADTLRDIAASANHALASLGRPTFPVPRYRHLAGQGLESLMIDALGAEHRDLVPEGMKRFREHYALHDMDHTAPYDGVPEVLDRLAAADVPMAVLSNKPHPATVKLVEKAFARWRFKAVRGHIPPTPLKPDPASALAIARELAIEPADWLYVGDTRVDMLTAVSAGMFAVGVLWGFRDEPELRQSGAAAIIRHPREIMPLMQG